MIRKEGYSAVASSIKIKMNAKVYVLIDVSPGKSGHVVETLQMKPGVIAVDSIEGPPDVIMIVRAADRQELAKLTIDALITVEGLTEEIKCLPVIEESIAHIPGSRNTC